MICLDFSALSMDTPQSLRTSLKRLITQALAGAVPDYVLDPGAEAHDVLNTFLSDQKTASTVLIIDEYDAPVTHFLNRPPKLQAVRSLMDNPFRMLKPRSDKLQFFFLTGVTRIAQIGIFSGFSHITGLTLKSNYASARLHQDGNTPVLLCLR